MFVIKKRKFRHIDDGSIAAIFESDVIYYARYLERLLKRRGVKYPGARFKLKKT